MSRKTIIVLAAALIPVAILVLLAATGWGGSWFEQFPNPHFVIAFALGATLTVLLAAGLFALVFISSRRGFDEGTENEMRDPKDAPPKDSPRDSDGP
jgi:hypothetical protein